MWLITGGAGQLGRALAQGLAADGVDHRALDRRELDITDAELVRRVVGRLEPGIIVNAAAWTAVDAAEDDPAGAFAINSAGAGHLASAARDVGATLVQVSTDYVFDGAVKGEHPEDGPTEPRSVYGRSKLEGEVRVREILGDDAVIVRTAWLYGTHGRNFVKTMVARALTESAVRVVDDQHGQPTYVADLADHIRTLVVSGGRGVFHGTNSGATTWWGLTRAIYESLGREPSLVIACASADYPTRAVRPPNSVLGHRRTLAAGIAEMRPWQDALVAALGPIVDAVRGEMR